MIDLLTFENPENYLKIKKLSVTAGSFFILKSWGRYGGATPVSKGSGRPFQRAGARERLFPLTFWTTS